MAYKIEKILEMAGLDKIIVLPKDYEIMMDELVDNETYEFDHLFMEDQTDLWMSLRRNDDPNHGLISHNMTVPEWLINDATKAWIIIPSTDNETMSRTIQKIVARKGSEYAYLLGTIRIVTTDTMKEIVKYHTK